MKRILEDLYHGNLTVKGQTFQRGTKYARALNRVNVPADFDTKRKAFSGSKAPKKA